MTTVTTTMVHLLDSTLTTISIVLTNLETTVAMIHAPIVVGVIGMKRRVREMSEMFQPAHLMGSSIRVV